MNSIQAKEPVNRGRHDTNCKVCRHPNRTTIEECASWNSPAQIAAGWKLPDRITLYRHALATGLMEKRRRNVPEALESIIERGAVPEPTWEVIGYRR